MPFPSVKLSNLGTKNFKVVQAAPRRVPDNMPSLHFLGLVVGSRGVGKTNAVLNLVAKYASTKAFDKLYLFSPTYHNDPKYRLFEELGITTRVFTEYTNDIFREVVEEIKKDIDEYKAYLKKKRAYDAFLHHKGPIEAMDPELLLDLAVDDFQEPSTPWKHGMPTSLIIFDDLVGNKDLYTSGPKGVMPSFAILHRHLLTSMLFIAQVYKGGLPRQLRNNLSLLVLFRNKSPEMKKEIAAEMSAYVDGKRFVEAWDQATDENKHDFFLVDFDTRDDTLRFRKNFNELLILQ